MNTGEFWELEHVSDAGLRRQLSELIAGGGRTEARIVAHLAEVFGRKLYLKDGFSSLYKYCLGGLGLSEAESFNRMTAAKIARRYPIVFEMLEQRRIHLTGICLLRDFLTPSNHRELLEAAAGKTKLGVREELAKRFPAARVKDSMRKLPNRRIEPAVGVLADAQVERVDPVTGEVSPAPDVPRLEGSVRYRVQFDAGSELKTKIEEALALSSHANPSGDLETLFTRALDVFVEQLQKKRFGMTNRPRRRARARARRISLRRAHIPHATRREVVERDGLQCAYVSATGQRCDERAFLQIHHDEAWARTRDDGAGNLRIFCAAHNRLRAEQDFGEEHVARCIERSRARTGS
jgi:5-methylcytosine-specific restriction endonuclease McrA